MANRTSPAMPPLCPTLAADASCLTYSTNCPKVLNKQPLLGPEPSGKSCPETNSPRCSLFCSSDATPVRLTVSTPQLQSSPTRNNPPVPYITDNIAPEAARSCSLQLHRTMSTKRSKAAATDDELGELFEGIGDDTVVKKSAKAKAAAAKGKPDSSEQDILAELENQLGEKAPSRPHTPRVRDVAPKASPAKRASANSPPPAVDTATPRKSAESSASYHASLTPSATSSEAQDTERKAATQQTQEAGSGGGSSWWGGLWSTAATAMKQAEVVVKEIQQNEEARKWADQVRGNVGALRGLGSCLSVPG